MWGQIVEGLNFKGLPLSGCKKVFDHCTTPYKMFNPKPGHEVETDYLYYI